jgi:hypothetical protein
MNDIASEPGIADVIIEGMPFSDEIIAWCHKYPEFKEALKVSNPDRFHALGMVLTSVPSAKPADYVVGFVAYDMVKKQFKQDFIVDVGNQHDEFVLYTKLPSKHYGKYVQSMKSFYTIYGKNGSYKGAHHFDLQYLLDMGNEDLSERARLVIKKGQAIIDAGGRRQVGQVELTETLAKIRAEKAKHGIFYINKQ